MSIYDQCITFELGDPSPDDDHPIQVTVHYPLVRIGEDNIQCPLCSCDVPQRLIVLRDAVNALCSSAADLNIEQDDLLALVQIHYQSLSRASIAAATSA